MSRVILRIYSSIPKMESEIEFIFVEGNSTDDTFEKIQSEILSHSKLNCQLLRQTGKGKGDAVRLGFSHAKGDILCILDADLTVSFDDIPKFYDALVTSKGEFINGVRLVYPMEKQAMRFFNILGNKIFSVAFSWLLNQSIKDTLCGTKMITNENWKKINENRVYFGNF